MPFFWNTIAKQGQIFGDPSKKARCTLTNGLKFSYPGYSEMLVGFYDERITSNDKYENPNPTVLEWLHARPGFGGRVAAFGSWDVVDWIVRKERCGFPVVAGFDEGCALLRTPRMELLDTLKRDQPRPWDSMPFDAVAFQTAMEYLVQRAPRVMYFAFGEVDEWAHTGAYDHYLDAVQRTDAQLRELWNALEQLPSHRGRTTVLIAPDHGRAVGADWSKHGRDIDQAEQTWLAVLGPDTEPLGEREKTPELTIGQIAATAAAFLGEDYAAAQPKAARAITEVLPRP